MRTEKGERWPGADEGTRKLAANDSTTCNGLQAFLSLNSPSRWRLLAGAIKMREYSNRCDLVLEKLQRLELGRKGLEDVGLADLRLELGCAVRRVS